ncbi:MAG: flagellin, partial [Succinivibrio sp.]|nr:flagellin [Succinivibrio sp.]
AVQSANGSNTAEDRASIQKEVTQLCAEITRIACETTFGGKTILNGTSGAATNNTNPRGSILAQGSQSKLGTLTFHVGANKSDTISLSLSSGFGMSQLQAAARGSSGTSCGTFVDVSATGSSTATVTSGSQTTTITFAQDDVGAYKALNVTTQTKAEDAIKAVDEMLMYVDNKCADLGSVQHRLESPTNNPANVSMNLSDARSRIRDTDFAEESSNLSQQSIIQQAATSMLTQANSRPQIALSLLG